MLLWLQGLIFTVLVPGVVAFYIPQTLRNGHAANGGWWSLGWIFFAVGALIYLRCLVDFLRAGGTPAVFFTRHIRAVIGEEPQQVVHNGLYRYSRNPMYVGVLTAIAGQAIVYRSRQIGIYLLVAAVTFHLVVVLLEEPHLARARGDSYRDYRRRVPRWLGLPRS
jgi:protein-S-isoprenylcysteine O-methyltransferase Ste14